jgi:hypothetical protein
MLDKSFKATACQCRRRGIPVRKDLRSSEQDGAEAEQACGGLGKMSRLIVAAFKRQRTIYYYMACDRTELVTHTL